MGKVSGRLIDLSENWVGARCLTGYSNLTEAKTCCGVLRYRVRKA